MMANGTLRQLWEAELQDLYSAEQQILTALPELIQSATSPALKGALDKHQQRTKIHVERLDLIFKQCGINTSSARPSGLDSLVRSGAERIKTQGASDVRDAAIIAAAQHVEHYEIAGYGCARTWARQLDDDNAADLLQQTLDEEGAADKELTNIAQSGINEGATAGARTGERRSRLRYVEVDDVPAAADYRDTKIRNRSGDDLGRIDGFILDQSGRAYYLVIDSGGLFVGRRYIVPIGRADFRRADRLFTIDLDKDTLKRYPEFHRDSFLSMDDDEARRYEWRVLEAIDPEAARSSGFDWDYERYPYYRQPDWFNRDLATPGGSVRAESRTPRTPSAPIVEKQERERVTAREERESTDESLRRERIRSGRSDEDIR
jgi:ferritin-like metal-binding protein YciE